MGLLSQDRVSFDPLKPVILRGPHTEDASSVFSGNIVLTLSKTTKISTISVTFKSTASTYWPEGIGARGTRLTSDKCLSEQTLRILPSKGDTKGYRWYVAGTHRFSFAFVVPNSLVETIEDSYGRVRHVVEAVVARPGISLLNSWHISSPVLVLRTFMSNSLLMNNSLQDLSRTFEKHMVAGDIEVVIEAAAFSAGDIFYIRMMIQPQHKHARLENVSLSITELRRYCVPEMRAWRTDESVFPLSFAGSTRLLDADKPYDIACSTDDIRPALEKNGGGIDLVDTFAHRIAFATPKCSQNIRHTTHFEEILFRHYLEINIVVSYLDDDGTRIYSAGTVNSVDSFDVPSSSQTPFDNRTASAPPSPGLTSTSGGWQNVLLRLRKSRNEQDARNRGRRRETIVLETPIIAFDCRLKEDYGRLPSYFELGMKVPDFGTLSKTKKGNLQKSDDPSPVVGKHTKPRAYHCPCYYDFLKAMELASQTLLLQDSPMPMLERAPSKPPPEYADT
ncbi:hypothetical protein EC973_006855 [Apophysomyces ossiformis]|uniref:Arrestin-like N-terminal domain-containing protein n=1 Tax=Apophysomyces ossiformis TaxID=679940 RepID=A0A8H7EQT6_9FUNG|nr:hypothetical protein EC973_006855 [Apophysomyces ossiformis]